MIRRSVQKIANLLTILTAFCGMFLLADFALANPLDAAFGDVTFHQSPTERRVTIQPRHVRENPNQPFATWTGYSTFPDFTPNQKRMIVNAVRNGANNGAGNIGGSSTSSVTIPYWVGGITSPLDLKTYNMSMVGSSPFAPSPSATTITYVPIVLKVTVGAVTYDPTRPACDDTVSVQNRFFNSPLFQATTFNSNGVSVSGQMASAFQRANFWNYVNSSSYGVNLTPSVAQPIVASVSLRGQNYNLSCSNGKRINLGAVNINTFDSAIQNLIAHYSTPTQLPIILTYNIVETQSGQCCILGYHNAVAVSGGVQTYATGAYIDGGIFSGTHDISVWTHEISEWLDDPFVQAPVAGGGSDDLTPSWGHVGQVSACQNNLEVGDPLSGTEYAVSGAGSFVYHYQDMAFYDWFYRTPAHGTNGRYSFVGNFTAPPPLC